MNASDVWSPHHHRTRMLVGIGIFKIFKAVLLVILGLAALKLVREQDGGVTFARHTIELFKLDPRNEQIHSAIARLLKVSPGHLELIGCGSFLYAVIFIVEGIGLIGGWYWAEYLVIASTTLLLPYEVYEFAQRVTLLKANVIVANLAIIAYLVYRVMRQSIVRRRHRHGAAPP